MTSPDQRPLLIEPVVAWPHRAETDCDYLVTVDLSGPLAPDGGEAEWPYPDEEFTFTVALDGSPHFVCTALDEPSVVLHRFGGTYGPASFRVTTGTIPGPAALWLTVSNQWGVPVRKAELRSEIWEREPGRAPAAQLAEVVRARASLPAPPRPRTPEPPSTRTIQPTPVPERSDPQTVTGQSFTGQTITISFAGYNRAWAVWIADRLEQRGRSVRLLRWDPSKGTSTGDAMRELLSVPGPVLLILSQWYFQLGPRSHDDWNEALREVVAPNADRFAAVSITSAPLPSATAVLRAVELLGVDAEEAERRLLRRLGVPTTSVPADSGRSRPRFPMEVPEVWGGVPRRNTRFTGREALLTRVGRLLQDRESGVAALCGMPGVGKTQLAIEYVYRFGSEYDVVWWVSADQRSTCREGLARLAPVLGLRTGQEIGERIRAVHLALREGAPYRRWLLVLDGADDPELVADTMPSGTGHVVITTRNADWERHDAALLEVPLYERAESVAFIRRRAPRLTGAEADQLAEALGDLPLALAQTAAWLSDSDMSVREYIAELESGGEYDAVTVSADFPLTFRTAWAILLNRLRDTAPESVDLLNLCMFFSPGSIPVRLLTGIPVNQRPESIRWLMDDQELSDRTLQRLAQYSVIRLESGGTAVYVHRMVHQIVRQNIPEDDAREYATAARAALAAAAPGRPGDPETWPAYAEIVPHLEYAGGLHDTDPAVQNLVLDCLRHLYLAGEYGTGLRLAEQAIPVWEALLDSDHPALWDLGHHYANLLRAVGDYRHSEAVSRAAAERHWASGRPDRRRPYLRAASGLAADLRALGRYQEAYGLSQEIYDAYEELVGDENDPAVLAARNNLAMSLRLLGDYRRARDTDRSVLHARDQVLGPRHPWTLLSEIHYATDLRLLGHPRDAVLVQAASAERHRAQLGPDHPQTLHAEYNLAMCRYQAGELEEAWALFASVVERGDWVVGEDDPLSLMFAVAHSCFVRVHGDLDRAREICEPIVARYEHMLGPAHPYVAGVHANQSLILRVVGEREEARFLADRACADMERAVGPGHPWALGCALNAAAAAALAGDRERALAMSLDTAARAEADEVLGPAHPLTLSARIALAADLRATGDRGEAERLEQVALNNLEATLGADHPRTRSARNRERPFWDFEPLTT
ncbi:ATP-binding protein [Streptomyces albiflavescens]|uniref:ATP-binding protein n=1 Tax=Streptomyces albiflavescens TaxID=1623582 RepID=A0A917Y9D1_9ACTN|nr:FxSxx-COOH system tetratricopeptide repeat protein [Streptomyces albiflavescens]GGN78027.1 ATP-binding protein [Streptomyces albiflavescens]